MTRKRISFILKALIALLSFSGVIIACCFALRDGYSHWTKRLLYFTQLSNIWIGVTSLLFVAFGIKEMRTGEGKAPSWLHSLRFAFTVSITVTGIIFCGFLAPFASDDYPAWTFASVLTHVAVPLLSIADFFVDKRDISFTKKHALYGIVPPAAYFFIASILCLAKVDFGRGDPYPYFFMNYYSSAGFFGVNMNSEPYPEIGPFYWISVFLLLVLGLSFGFYKLHEKIRNKKA
jgi:hypothetical protein